MTARTYTFDADMCDRWLTESVRRDGSARVAPDRPMVDAIRAQQPKPPRIPWEMGRSIRAIGPNPATWLMASHLGTDSRHLICTHEGGGIPMGAIVGPHVAVGYDGESFDPAAWEVVE